MAGTRPAGTGGITVTVRQVMEHSHSPDRWSVGRHRKTPVGSSAWLLLQGESEYGRGLIGHCIVTSETDEAKHYSDPVQTIRYVEFDALLPLGTIPYARCPRGAVEQYPRFRPFH